MWIIFTLKIFVKNPENILSVYFCNYLAEFSLVDGYISFFKYFQKKKKSKGFIFDIHNRIYIDELNTISNNHF